MAIAGLIEEIWIKQFGGGSLVWWEEFLVVLLLMLEFVLTAVAAITTIGLACIISWEMFKGLRGFTKWLIETKIWAYIFSILVTAAVLVYFF